jgi:hypothetical protein
VFLNADYRGKFLSGVEGQFGRKEAFSVAGSPSFFNRKICLKRCLKHNQKKVNLAAEKGFLL